MHFIVFVDRYALVFYKVHRINAEGTKYIASACRNIDAKMMYISMDYVFNGQGTEPWHPDCVGIWCKVSAQ